MRRVEEIFPWFYEQLAVTKDSLNYYKSPSLQHLPDTGAMINYCVYRIDCLEKLCSVLQNYQKFDNEGLSGNIDLTVLNELKSFCIKEKERYTDAVYDNIQIKEKFYKAFQDGDAMIYFQEAELYVIKLISDVSNV